MLIIFLDFDGVLNSSRWLSSDREPDAALRAVAAEAPADIMPDYIRNSCAERQTVYSLAFIDPEAVALLNALVALTGAKIVISSTWRHAYTATGLQWILDRRGFQGQVIDLTPQSHPKFRVRGDEIQAWLDHKLVEGFVILDDDADMGHLAHRLVRTDREVGLSAVDVAHAATLLIGGRPALPLDPVPPLPW